jgi:hypothetical protein
LENDKSVDKGTAMKVLPQHYLFLIKIFGESKSGRAPHCVLSRNAALLAWRFLRTLSIGAGLLGLAWLSSAHGTEILRYTVQGVIERHSLRSQAAGNFYYVTNRVEFELVAGGSRWLIKLTPEPPAEYQMTVSSDGENLYLLLSYKLTASGGAGPGQENTFHSHTEGTVAKGNVPRFGLAEEAGALWLAYASQAAFAPGTGSASKTVPFTRYIRRPPVGPGEPPVMQTAHWIASNVPPFLPVNVSYLTEARGHERAGGSFSGRHLTNVQYHASFFLEVNGFQFPKESETLVYGIFNGPEGENFQLAEAMRITALRVTPNVSLSSFQPPLPGPTLVNEERFNNGSGLSFAYMAENHWPAETEVRSSPAYAEAVAALKCSKPRSSRWSRAVLALGLGITAVAFFCRFIPVRRERS